MVRGNDLSDDLQPLFKLLRVIAEKIEMGIRRSDGLSFIYPIDYRSGDSKSLYVCLLCRINKIILSCDHHMICLSVCPSLFPVLWVICSLLKSCGGHVRVM